MGWLVNGTAPYMPMTEVIQSLLIWILCALAVHLYGAWIVYYVNINKENPERLQWFLIGQSLVIGFVLAGWITSAGACS